LARSTWRERLSPSPASVGALDLARTVEPIAGVDLARI
jgi:hypothetical protein